MFSEEKPERDKRMDPIRVRFCKHERSKRSNNEKGG